jgi:hypothetical protein
MHQLGVHTQVTLDCGSGARHYGTPDAHSARAPDVLLNGLGLVPLGRYMQSKEYTKYVQKCAISNTINSKLSENAFNEPDGSPVESPSVDDLPNG